MLVMEKKPKSIEAEAYRSLRSNIEYSSFDKEYKVIVVTSSVPGEGKSTTASNLALSMANGDKQVLLVDCDMRKPTLHKKMNLSNIYGLPDLLLNNDKMEKIAKKYNDNLTVITAGKIPPNPAEMLASKAMSVFLDEMKEHFDYIVLDAPPLMAVTDAQILSTKADGVVLVVKANDTKKEIVNSAMDLIKKVNGKIIGTVLNGVEEDKHNHYYYYGEK